MKQNENPNQQQTPDGSRRAWLRRMIAGGAGLACLPTASAGAYDSARGLAPDERAFEDALEVVAIFLGYGDEYPESRRGSDDDLLTVLWRFHLLADAVADDWFRRMTARLDEYNANYHRTLEEQRPRAEAYLRELEERSRVWEAAQAGKGAAR
jgi:hypothetical protein